MHAGVVVVDRGCDDDAMRLRCVHMTTMSHVKTFADATAAITANAAARVCVCVFFIRIPCLCTPRKALERMHTHKLLYITHTHTNAIRNIAHTHNAAHASEGIVNSVGVFFVGVCVRFVS